MGKKRNKKQSLPTKKRKTGKNKRVKNIAAKGIDFAGKIALAGFLFDLFKWAWERLPEILAKFNG